jgi:3-dehydroquinate dehydratase/shikimate dehydrogenase
LSPLVSDSTGSAVAPRAHTDLVATLTDVAQLETLTEAALRSAGWLEVRADLVGDLDPSDLRNRFSGELLYTLRSREEGGRGDSTASSRHERLLRAAQSYDLVDFEVARDGAAARGVPVEKRLLSWHDHQTRRTSFEELSRRVSQVDELAARFRKLIPAAQQPADALVPLRLLAETKRRDLTCFAMGDVASWTRVVAPRLGSVFVFGALGDAAAPGQLSVRQLVEDYGLPELAPVEGFFGIVGDPVSGSLSPRIHNGAYRDLQLPYCYLAFRAPAFGEFWLEVVESDVFSWLGAPLRALSVTAPHKKSALAVAGASSPRAQRINSANTLVQRNGVWEAESTDPEGVSRAVQRRRRSNEVGAALVLGSGGAGRAAVVGLQALGYEVTLSNRSEDTGAEVAQRLGVQFLPRSAVREADYEVLVNATALGRSAEDRLALVPGRCRTEALVVDMVYGAQPTALEQAAETSGIECVSGREVLLMQAVEQFERMTGNPLPVEAAARRIGLSGVTPLEDLPGRPAEALPGSSPGAAEDLPKGDPR